MKKRILSLLLTLVMILGMIPATTLTAFAESGKVIEGIEGLGTPDNPYLIKNQTQWTTLFGDSFYNVSSSGFDGQYVKLCSDIEIDSQYIYEDTHLDLNGYTCDEWPILVRGDKGDCVVEVTGSGAAYVGTKYGGTLILNDNVDFLEEAILNEGTIILNSPSAKGVVTMREEDATLIIKQGTVTDLFINGVVYHDNYTFNGVSDVFMYGGRLEDNFFSKRYNEGAQINFAFYGGVIAPDEVSQDKDKYYDDKEAEYVVTNTSYAFSKDGTTKKIASYDDLVDAIRKYGEFDVYAPYFAEQFPEMPAGQTTHDLGKVSASEYVMTFASQDTLPSTLGVSGCKVIEQLVVYDSNGEIVDTVTNNPKLTGTGISYSLKNLPSGNYTIRESIILYDKDGKALLGTNNDFILEVENIVNNINVSATFSGTPAKATTSTTGATVTATKWYKKNGSSWTELGASDTIKEGYTYRCEVTVATTDGYPLADGYTVKINGIAATKKSGNTWYVDRTITGYTSYVDVYDIALPEAGVHPDFTYNDVDCYRSSVALVEWFECDKDGKKLSGALSADYKFKEDAYYRLEVTAVPDTNYLFDTRNLDFFIGSKAVQYYYPYQDTTYPNSVTGWKVYHVDDANGTYTVQIGDITLKDGDYLANNATAVTTSKPSGGYAYYKDGVLTLNNFVSKNLIRYYERYLEVELIGENKIGAIADYYYWDGNASNDYFTGLEFCGSGNLEFGYYSDKPYSNVSVNGDVFFNGSGNISLDAEIYCFQFTDNVIINDGYVSCYCAQSNVFSGNANITVNGGKLQMTDGGCWYGSFICEDDLFIYAGNVYVSVDPRKIELEDCVPWDGVTNLNTYDSVWIVPEKVSGSGVTVNCIGSINYTVSGQTVTVNHSLACKVGYLSGGSYVAIAATKNGDGTYSFTAPASVTEVVLVVKGDVSGDARINMGDVSKLYAHIKGTNILTGDALFMADISGDRRINMGDVSKLYAHIKGTNLLTWDT